MGSNFGTAFRVTTFGESHGVALGCVVDGCPAGLPLRQEDVQESLNRRRPGQSVWTTPREEGDECEILSGLENGVTLGSPISIMVRNSNQKPKDYQDVAQVFRPSHGDFTTEQKYGVVSASGGGRASARETIGRVAAGAVARVLVRHLCPKLEVVAWVSRMGNESAQVDSHRVTLAEVEKSLLRCPDLEAESRMKSLLEKVKTEGDSVGGLIECVLRGVPVGLGAPVFDKLEADLAKAMLSLPATKSFEVGSGLAGTYLKGSEHNDAFCLGEQGQVQTQTNFSGGIQAGISNGMPILFSVGFKPVSTIFQAQQTLSREGKEVIFQPKSGRHDACVLPRAVPIVEAMAWLVIADHLLRLRMDRL
jgi:chorismate synthase